MAKDAARTDDQVVNERSDGVNFWGSNKDAEWIVLLWNPPKPRAGLDQVHFAFPTSHDQVLVVTPRPRETQSLPEPKRGWKIVAWNYGKGAYGIWNWH